MDTAEQFMFEKRGHTRLATEPKYSSSSSRHSEVSQTTSGARTTSQISLHAGRSNKKPKKKKPRKAALDNGVIDTPHDEDILEDHVLFLSVNTELNESIARTIVPETLGFHYADIHQDKERYPEVGDPEFEDYRYMPRPWPSETPYPSHEVWHYFMHPEDCGTSMD
ncbi:MAG: hypothetical protein M1818_007457 [Claussenomyces sp. TS43310]|nr:MAG: hypothetical protein M1818_007457 [Claussenomyces sp. TS43310]